MSTLSTTRRLTSRKLSGLEIPGCFADASAAAEARLLAVEPRKRTPVQRRDLRRISRQAAGAERAVPALSPSDRAAELLLTETAKQIESEHDIGHFHALAVACERLCVGNDHEANDRFVQAHDRIVARETVETSGKAVA